MLYFPASSSESIYSFTNEVQSFLSASSTGRMILTRPRWQLWTTVTWHIKNCIPPKRPLGVLFYDVVLGTWSIPPQYSFYRFGIWGKRLKKRLTVCSLRQGQPGGGGGGGEYESEFSRVTSHNPPLSERVSLHAWSRISKDGAMVKSTHCF